MSIRKRYAQLKSKILQPFAIEPPYHTIQSENGEFQLLSFASRSLPPRDNDCMIDVGAALGDWTAEAISIFRDRVTTFEAVEPMPGNADTLRRRFADEASVTVHECAMSDADKSAVTMYNVGGGGRMAAPRPGSKKKSSAHTVFVGAGDNLFESRRPYFIKIDCDGYDFRVLSGFSGTLRKARPIVQFEYCDMWQLHGARLRDAADLLGQAGFQLYRLWSDRLTRLNFSGLYETYHYQNIVAIPRERTNGVSEIFLAA